MKVLRVLGGLDPKLGGPTASSVNSIVAAARQGCDTHVVVPGNPQGARVDRAALDRLARAGVTVDVLPFGRPQSAYLRSIGFSPAAVARLCELVAVHDVVHVHGAWLHTSLAAVRAAKARGRPVVMTPHESLTAFDTRGGRMRVLRRLKAPLKRYYLRTLDAIVFASPLELRDTVPDPDSPRWSVVPHPVLDETRHDPAPRRFALEPHAPLRVGYLGRLHPKKNVHLLIDALAALPATVVLTIAGDGETAYAAGLRQRARERGVAERITWLGFLTGAEKDAFLRSIDLLTMPSVYECFGMAVVEAMIAGTPVLVTPETGVADVVRARRAGWVVDPTPHAIIRTIASFVPDRQQLADFARSASVAAAGAFSFGAHGEGLMRVYSHLPSQATGSLAGEPRRA